MDANAFLVLAEKDRAESALLGGILRFPTIIADVAILVSASDFRVDAHQRIYRAILDLWDHSKQIDLVTVANALRLTGEIENIGGYGYLAELWDLIGHGATAVTHAKLVRGNATLRRLAAAGKEIAHEAENPASSPEDTLAAAEKRIFALGQAGSFVDARPLADAINVTFDQIDRAESGQASLVGISSGYSSLDTITGGWLPSELTLLAARPSQGKTAFALALARNASGSGATVFFASLEQALSELGQRVLCSEAGVDSRLIRHGRLSGEHVHQLLDAGDVLRPLSFWIDDSPSQTILRISSMARRIKSHGPLDILFIDYIGLITSDERSLPRHEQVASISRRLKGLARELKIPVVALCQVKRESEDRTAGKPKLSDLRESSALEQDADKVIFLHNPDPRLPPTQQMREVLVLKNRNGPLGEVTLSFDASTQRFRETYIPFTEAG